MIGALAIAGRFLTLTVMHGTVIASRRSKASDCKAVIARHRWLAGDSGVGFRFGSARVEQLGDLAQRGDGEVGGEVLATGLVLAELEL